MAIRYVLKFEVIDNANEGGPLYSDTAMLLTPRLGDIEDRAALDLLAGLVRPRLAPTGDTAGELAALAPVTRRVTLPREAQEPTE